MNIIRRVLQKHIGSLSIHRRATRREMSPNEGTYVHKGQTTACGRSGCIAVYRSANCHFCDAARAMLQEAVTKQGLPEKVIHEIDTENMNENYFEIISESPMIRICDRSLTGIPLEDGLADAIKKASKKSCFECNLLSDETD